MPLITSQGLKSPVLQITLSIIPVGYDTDTAWLLYCRHKISPISIATESRQNDGHQRGATTNADTHFYRQLIELIYGGGYQNDEQVDNTDYWSNRKHWGGAAVALAKRGARVVLLGRRLETLEARADSIRIALSEAQTDYQDTDVATLVVDFSDMASVKCAAAESFFWWVMTVLFAKSPAFAGEPIADLMLSHPGRSAINGALFKLDKRVEKPDKAMNDQVSGKRLWDELVRLTELTPE